MAPTEGSRPCDGCEQDCSALEICSSDELRDSNVPIGQIAREVHDRIVSGDRREIPNERDLDIHELMVVTGAATTVRFKNLSKDPNSNRALSK
jgi:hypothetical protein